MSNQPLAPDLGEIPAELLARPFALHSCEAPCCDRLAYGKHCEHHETAEDRELLQTHQLALLEAAEAEERWREARLRVLAAERAAGVRRAPVAGAT